MDHSTVFVPSLAMRTVSRTDDCRPARTRAAA
jgi:hypothetical protein